MKENFYILEKLEKIQIELRLKKLSKALQNKKVVLYGANEILEAICSKFNIKEYFNIIGVCDDKITSSNIFEQEEFKIISVQNLYFCGADVILNLKNTSNDFKKYLRQNHLVKKRVQFVNLLDKPLLVKIKDLYNVLKMSFSTYQQTKEVLPILKALIEYSDDEVYSRLNYQTKVFNLKNSEKPVRVLFLAFDYNEWTLSSLYYKFRSDENFKVLPIVALPSTAKEEYQNLQYTIDKFNQQGMECIDGSDTGEGVMIKALRPDLIIYQNPQYLKDEYTPAKLSEFALTCYVEPKFNTDKAYSIDDDLVKDRLSNSWQLYSSNKYSLKSYKHSAVSGFTLFEKYQQDTNSTYDKLWNVPSTVENNRIVYIPSYTVSENYDIASFRENQRFILDYIATHPQYSFVVIQDTKFKQQCLENSVVTEEEFDQFFNSFSSLPNVKLEEYSSIVGIFKTSNLLLTDSINSAMNYFPCGNPIIYINSSKQPFEGNEISEKIFKTFYKISSKEALDVVLEDLLLAQNDYNLKQRFTIIGKDGEYFNSNASDFIFEDIKSKLEKNIQEEIETKEEPQTEN